jgi:hypothetical protein
VYRRLGKERSVYNLENLIFLQIEGSYMNIGWNFPSNNHGQLMGISEAGIETFKGAPYSSLAREVCQNSLDARFDEGKPVTVEFTKIYLDSNELLGIDELRDALNRCNDFWGDMENKKTVDFFTKALNVINSDKIPVLRISDFNTTGLTGADKEYNTPWQNLVKASGVSDKGGFSGGSFGIGKSAPFACSELRTVIYSTVDKDGLSATQGVARLVSFKNSNDETTQGIGYYGEKARNTALWKNMHIDSSFNRSDRSGTDLFVIGFIEDNDWEKVMIKSILDGFLISIFQGSLIIKIGENEISNDTISLFIDKYKDEIKLTYDYYQVLTSAETKKIVTNFEKLGEIELYVLFCSNLHRKVLVSRNSGMKIFDKQNISSTIHFSGILILKSKEINAYFREMETPQHNAWEPDRYLEPAKVREAKKTRTNLFKYIKDTILGMARYNPADEIDADGVGNYLPDDPSLTQTTNPKENSEAITDKIKDIEFEVIDKTSFSKDLEKIQGQHSDEEIDAFGESDDEGKATGHKTQGTNRSQGGKRTALPASGKEGSEHKIKKEVEVSTLSVRLFKIDDTKNRYQLSLTPKNSAPHGYIKVKLAGEQSNVNAVIKSAFMNDDNTKPLKCNDGKIFINNFSAKQKITISFLLDYIENCSMEVELYGYSA